VVDIEVGDQDKPGILLTNTKHIYGDTRCSCGHITRAEPYRCPKEEGWEVEISQWHLVGPKLMSLIIFLSLRMRMSRARIKEFLQDWLRLHLSIGTINQCIHEGGRAVEPVEEQIIQEIISSDLLHADETSWKESGHLLWLWVFTTVTVTLYLIGYRGKAVIDGLLGDKFLGWLMSDGYMVYRSYKNRLRCWAHLIRKAQGLKESVDQEAFTFGTKAVKVLTTLMEAIYQAREGSGIDLVEKYDKLLKDFGFLCEQYQDAVHEKTRALAREFLNDWEAIFRVLKYPYLPLTNNEAERALRHWIIARKLSLGTRTKQGSRAFALLASVIETCRKRNVSPWDYLAEVITARRSGGVVPPLPAMG
jgi:transposase